MSVRPGGQVGVLIAQMLDAMRVRVDASVGDSLVDMDFTGASRIYTR